ncbi:MAG: hypothetical protein ACRDRK_03400 [Pseudonocardia sp.]
MSREQRGPNGRWLGWDGKETDEPGSRLFELREAGYTGWIDQDGHAVACPCCGEPACSAGLTQPCNGGGS